ncbi:hypothetical protein LC612_33895 [Nostoc sp. CHAB 5834]|nr:hypothetical protein [Nostoc sp. CHAB 5834]
MADEIDIANEQAERWLNQSLATLAAGKAALTPKYHCYFCEAAFEEGDTDRSRKLFCDVDCRTDYENEQRLKKLR